MKFDLSTVVFLEFSLELSAANSQEPSFLVWDKNDDADLRFVTSAANIRAFIFGINLTSKFDVKSMAGNIIPAVATTNAIVAGITVLQAKKILQRLPKMKSQEFSLKQLTNVFISTDRKTGAVIQSISLEQPNPSCIQCSDLEQPVRVRLNLSLFTLKNLSELVIKKELNMKQVDVVIGDGSGRILISADDDDDDNEQMMSKSLDQFKLINGSILLCEEETTDQETIENYKVKLIVEHQDSIQDKDQYLIVNQQSINRKERTKKSLKRKLSETKDDDDQIQHLDQCHNDSIIVKKSKRLSAITLDEVNQ